jgi:hypothetical protein
MPRPTSAVSGSTIHPHPRDAQAFGGDSEVSEGRQQQRGEDHRHYGTHAKARRRRTVRCGGGAATRVEREGQQASPGSPSHSALSLRHHHPFRLHGHVPTAEATTCGDPSRDLCLSPGSDLPPPTTSTPDNTVELTDGRTDGWTDGLLQLCAGTGHAGGEHGDRHECAGGWW